MDNVVVWTQKGKKIFTSHQETKPYTVDTFRDIYNIQRKERITRKADRVKPIFLGMAHVLNLRSYTMRAGYDPKIIHIEFVVDKLVLGQDLLRENQTLM